MSDPTAARARAIEIVNETIGFDRSTVEADMLASEIVASLLVRPEVLRALAGAPTADVAEEQTVPMCPDHQTPGAGGRPIASPQMGCVACAAWMAAPEGVDAADELTAAQAAIQRVRELCLPASGGPLLNRALFARDVLRALDGDTTEEKR